MEKFGAPRGKRPRVQVSMEQKEQAIARILNGETKAGISRELGVPESTVRGWVKRSEQRSARETKDKQNLDKKPSPLQVLKLPQKRNFNGHSLAADRKYMRDSLSMQMQTPSVMPTSYTLPTMAPVPCPISVPLPLLPPVPLSVPQTAVDGLNQTDDSQMIYWLHIFNAGVLNFTWIVTAAVQHARTHGYAERLTLWQIINIYVEEAARNVAANAGIFVNPLPKTQTTRIGNISQTARLHITAEDDEEDDEQ
ncbi:GL17502 [Drosophila persimilis]|uniref:GL17502 n=1 Tax=Drosophila persimilis TaxID=7234 RepID=B4GHC6_DROPE|nr:uncharacterized protein LOC6592412 [Drosophila persimilis]EDW35896.1 GL17502 [Drosophila persimilis]